MSRTGSCRSPRTRHRRVSLPWLALYLLGLCTGLHAAGQRAQPFQPFAPFDLPFLQPPLRDIRFDAKPRSNPFGLLPDQHVQEEVSRSRSAEGKP